MYSGFGKQQGDIVGFVLKDGATVDLNEASESSNAEESLVCLEPLPGGQEGEFAQCCYNACLNASTGEVMWKRVPDESTVFRKTVAMGQMTSMLHDGDRNNVYSIALEKCITSFTNTCGRPPSVLDVGTGTGLLAMMAVKHGASVVVGCEMFSTMAEIAEAVVASNGMQDSISIMACKSNEMELGGRADVLVSELLDSALLGEGCLVSHADAIRRLVARDIELPTSVPVSQRVIPNRARVQGTLVECSTVRGYSTVGGDWFGARASSHRRPEDAECKAGVGLPVHYERLKNASGARELSDPTDLIHVRFFDAPEAFLRESVVHLEATADGTVSMLLLSWEVYLLDKALDPEEIAKYSTAPGAQNWQDHWIQMAYTLPEPIQCHKGDRVEVRFGNDAMRIWLISAEKCSIPNRDRDLPKAKKQKSGSGLGLGLGLNSGCVENVPPPHACTCGWHLLYGPERMLQLNDQCRMRALLSAIHEVRKRLVLSQNATEVNGDVRIVLDVSDGSTLPLMFGESIADLRVVSLEKKHFSRMLHGQLLDVNSRADAMAWDGNEFDEIVDYFEDDAEAKGGETLSSKKNVKIVSLLCECFFYQLPTLPLWAAIKFMYMRSSKAVHSRLEEGAPVMPCRARIMAAAVELADLHVSHGTVGSVCGFDHSVLDTVQSGWEEYNFPYSLGGYSHKLLTEPAQVLTLNYEAGFFPDAPPLHRESKLIARESGVCHAVALWVDYDLTENVSMNLRHDETGSFPLHAKTMLRFFASPTEIKAGVSCLACSVTLVHGNSDFNFSFDTIS